MSNLSKIFQKSIDVKKEILQSNRLDILKEIGDEIVDSLINKKKLLLCGNGGSAADAQHLAAELLIRLKPFNNRDGIPAIALAQDTSTITACGNDYGFDLLFKRVLESIGNEGDSLLCISTSGNSKNIILAIEEAKKMGIKTFGFLGSGGGICKDNCDKAFIVPSNETGRIQESHITAGHALMEHIEDSLIKRGHITLNQ